MKELSQTTIFSNVEFTVIPAGEYIVEYKGYKEKVSKNGKSYVMQMFKIVDDLEYQDSWLFDNFFYVDNDDKFYDKAIYKYRTLTSALNIEGQAKDIIDVSHWSEFVQAKGNRLIVSVINRLSKDGKVYNNIAGYSKYHESDEDKKLEDERLQRAFDPQLAEISGNVTFDDEIPF